jgi:hypothetical protein
VYPRQTVSYRDEDDAQRARVDALQDEVSALREENERLKAPPPKSAPKSAPRSAPKSAPKKQGEKPTSFARKGKRDEWLFILGSAFGACALLAVSAYVPIGLGHEMPSVMGLGFAAMLGVLLGSVTVPSTLLRILLPAVPIMERQNEEGGGRVEVFRSMKTRKIYFAVSLVLYVAGTVGWFIVTTKT